LLSKELLEGGKATDRKHRTEQKAQNRKHRTESTEQKAQNRSDRMHTHLGLVASGGRDVCVRASACASVGACPDLGLHLRCCVLCFSLVLCVDRVGLRESV